MIDSDWIRRTEETSLGSIGFTCRNSSDNHGTWWNPTSEIRQDYDRRKWTNPTVSDLCALAWVSMIRALDDLVPFKCSHKVLWMINVPKWWGTRFVHVCRDIATNVEWRDRWTFGRQITASRWSVQCINDCDELHASWRIPPNTWRFTYR